ncbi:ABC transporter ATP-binding protein [bacterium]|nr:ABC transporter ATP-binding protein [bacterium]
MHYLDGARTVRVFDNLSLAVKSGTSIAIIGESGIGKSTLLNLLGTLETPTSGSIQLGDFLISDGSYSTTALAKFRSEQIGFIFQFHHLLPEFTALENVMLPLLIQGRSVEAATNAAREILVKVGLEERLTHRPTMLSGGEQQRVAIARALVHRPKLLLADEPTGNLDLNTAKEIQNLLQGIQVTTKVTMILVTHSRELANSLDRIFELTSNGLVEKKK